MGYYNKGTYGGSGSAGEERQSARDRYLDLLTKQRTGDQMMVDRMEGDVRQRRMELEKEKKEVSMQGAGDEAARGAQTGMQASGGNWLGGVIGAIIGKMVGANEHRKKYGLMEGFKAAHNPFSTPKALLGFGGQGAAGAGAGIANQVRGQVDKNKNDKLIGQLEAQKQGGEYGDLEKASYQAADEQDANTLMGSVSSEPMTPEEQDTWNKYYKGM